MNGAGYLPVSGARQSTSPPCIELSCIACESRVSADRNRRRDMADGTNEAAFPTEE